MVLTDGQPVEADWSSPAVYLHKYDMFFFKNTVAPFIQHLDVQTFGTICSFSFRSVEQ